MVRDFVLEWSRFFSYNRSSVFWSSFLLWFTYSDRHCVCVAHPVTLRASWEIDQGQSSTLCGMPLSPRNAQQADFLLASETHTDRDWTVLHQSSKQCWHYNYTIYKMLQLLPFKVLLDSIRFSVSVLFSKIKFPGQSFLIAFYKV